MGRQKGWADLKVSGAHFFRLKKRKEKMGESLRCRTEQLRETKLEDFKLW